METDLQLTEIDPNRLDLECIRIPHIFLQAVHASSDAKRTVDEAKAEIAVVEAEEAQAIRDNPARYGLEKITEAAIAQKVALSERFRAARQRLIEASHQSDLAWGLVQALETKKKSLSMLVELHGLGYFSEVRLKKDDRDRLDYEVQKHTRPRARMEHEHD
jgi:hypothetical protein